jgi:hypothetical protein
MRAGLVKRIALFIITPVMAAGLPVAAIAAGIAASATPAAAATAPAPPCTPTDGGPLQFNVQAQGCISTIGDVDTWTFTVDKNTYPNGVTIQPRMGTLPDGTADLSYAFRLWTLRDSAGRVIFDEQRADTMAPLGLPPNAPGQNYILTVRLSLANRHEFSSFGRVYPENPIGPYRFRIALPQVSVWSLAIGDTVATDAPLQGMGNIEWPYAVDRYDFTVPAGGKRIYVQADGRNMHEALTDSTGNQIYSLEGTADPYAGHDGVMYLRQGSYSLYMFGVGGTGGYSFKLWDVPAPEYFPSPTTFTALTSTGLTYSENIESPGAVDVYRFSTSTATTLDIEDSFGCYARWTLTFLASGFTTTRPAGACGHTYVPISSGNYSVTMAETPGAQAPISSYTLKLTPSTTAPTANAYVRTASTSTPIAIGTLGTALGTPSHTTKASRTIAAGAADVYKFTSAAGQQAWFRATTASTASTWRLFTPDGRMLFDDPLTKLDAVRLPLDGDYTLVIFNTTSVQTTAGLELDVAAAPTVTGLGRADALTSSRSGTLSATGQEQDYTFTMTAGERLFVTTSPASIARELRAPDNSIVLQDWSDKPYATVTQPGTYRLRISASAPPPVNYAIDFLVAPVQTFDLGALGTNPLSLALDNINGTACDVAHNVTAPCGAGNLDRLYARDVYRFTGTAGQFVFLRNDSGTGTGFELRDPDGLQMAAPDGTAYRWVLDAGAGPIRLPRSGTYTLTLWRWWADTGTYGVSLIPTYVKSFTGGPRAVSGNLDVVGAQHLYKISALAGQQINFSGLSGAASIVAELLGPNGTIQKFHGNGDFKNTSVASLAEFAPSAPLPSSGEYTLRISANAPPGQPGTRDTGTYGFTFAVTGAETSGLPRQDLNMVLDKAATTPTLYAPNDPDVGAGLIEQANSLDVYHLDIQAGDALDISLTKTDTDLRLIGNHHGLGCGTGVSGSLRWTLRDPDGLPMFDQTIFCQTGDTGRFVAARGGVYTVAIFGASAPDTYDLAMWPLLSVAPNPPLDEVGEAAGPSSDPAISRKEPSSSFAGASTTVTLFGTNMPAPAAVHFTKDTQHPRVSLVESHAARGSAESVVAVVDVDFTNATPGVYDVIADLPDGRTVASHFQLDAATTAPAPQVNLTGSGFERIRYGALNRAFVNVSNPTDSDLAVQVHLGVPAGFGTVRLLIPVDRQKLLETMRRLYPGATMADINATWPDGFERDDPQTDSATGQSTLTTDVLRVPARGSVTVAVEILLPQLLLPAALSMPVALSASVAAAEDEPAPCSGGSLDEARSEMARNINYWHWGWTMQWGQKVADLADEAYNIDHQIGDNNPDPNAHLSQGTKDLIQAVVADTVPMIPFYGIKYLAGQLGKLLGLGAPAASWLYSQLNSMWIFRGDFAGIGGATITVWNWAKGLVCDPNDLIGPGHPDPTDNNPTVTDGGPIHAGEDALYTVDFENIGSLAVRKVAVDLQLSQQLDASRFELQSARLGSVDVSMSELPTPRSSVRSWTGHATVPINGTTNELTVSARFNPAETPADDLPARGLRVQYAAPPLYDVIGMLDTSSDILPPNTAPPAGEGFFTYVAPVKKELPVGTEVYQSPATIRFDPDQRPAPPAPIDTKAWKNTVSGDYTVYGKGIKIQNNPVTAAQAMKLELLDPALGNVGNPRAGAGLAITVTLDSGVKATYQTNPSGWYPLNYTRSGAVRIWRYRGVLDDQHAISSIFFDTVRGKFKVAGKGAAVGLSLVSVPHDASIVVTNGGSRFCADFKAINIRRPPTTTKFLVTKAPPPTACPN